MLDAAQRQRKLAAKAARRKVIVAEKKKIEGAISSLAGRVHIASRGRIVRCLVPSTLFDIGIGSVIVARALPSGLLGCGYFLIDVFCLGIKDAFYTEISEKDFRSRLVIQDEEQKFIDVEPAYARKLIRDAATYAASLGLAAAKDTPAVEAIFGNVDADACAETFTFGKDGKPFYISGPYDTPARIRAIARALEQEQGRGNWDYIVQASPELDNFLPRAAE